MNNISDVIYCTGCTACANICPKNAIKMIEQSEGFKYPTIDPNKCIDCGLCKNVCPVTKKKNDNSINKCYAGYNNMLDDRMKASSGSIFSLIAEYVLNENGIVIGAAFDKDLNLKHIAIEKIEELDKIKGSKYLQSDLDKLFTFIKNNIKDRKVLFTGTPCQVAGLKSYIGEDKNLLCVDLICHGVPSPKLFRKYVKEIEEKYNNKLIYYNFRDKVTGWDTYSNTAIFKGKIVSQLKNNNDYMNIFLSDIALRESCYNCNFKLGNKYSDITLGDFWGIKNYYPEMYDNKGISAIIINTQNGINIFDKIKNKLTYKECSIEEIVSSNQSLIKSASMNFKRNSFFCDLDKLSVKELKKKYIPNISFIKKIVKKIRKR